jgi:hypothetical protein
MATPYDQNNTPVLMPSTIKYLNGKNMGTIDSDRQITAQQNQIFTEMT